MKSYSTAIAILILLFTTMTCIAESAPSNIIVLIQTNVGDIKVALDDGPTVTKENFLHYVKSGYYKNTIFHRVMKSFMIQGGGFTEDMREKIPDAKPIVNEGKLCGTNTRGTIAMARTAYPHSATSQFFINTADNPFLNFTAETSQGWGYCSFGHVTEGMEVVDNIEAVSTTTVGYYQDVPKTSIVIKNISLVE